MAPCCNCSRRCRFVEAVLYVFSYSALETERQTLTLLVAASMKRRGYCGAKVRYHTRYKEKCCPKYSTDSSMGTVTTRAFFTYKTSFSLDVITSTPSNPFLRSSLWYCVTCFVRGRFVWGLCCREAVSDRSVWYAQYKILYISTLERGFICMVSY